MVTSQATATWKGGLQKGTGEFSAASGAFSGSYSFATRFQGSRGTNPEELIAAAHAACLSMALSGALEREGTPPESITTSARCTIQTIEGKPKITTMHLLVEGRVPGIDLETFKRAAEGAKDGCPVSKALKNNVEFKLEASLTGP